MSDDYRDQLKPFDTYGSGDPGAAAFTAGVTRFGEELEVTYAPHLPQDREAAILDVGCGQGHCIAWLRQLGYRDVQGVDYSPTMLAVAQTHIGQEGLHHISDLADWLTAHPAQFDAILLNQVIEHFTKRDVTVYLPLIRHALRPGGVVLIQTPNMCAFDAMRNRYVDFTHELGFTENSLTQVLQLAGFSGIRMIGSRLPLKGSPRRRLFRLLKRLQELWMTSQYWIALGVDRPRVVSSNLTGIASRPQGDPR